MPHAEIIYETGSHSVVSYENEDELKSALSEQHRRAVSGENGGPTGHPAERVKSVLLYDDHPGDHTSSGLISTNNLTSAINKLDMGGQISANEVITAIQNLVSAVVIPSKPEDLNRHASIFVAPEKDHLDLSFLEEVK